MNFTFDYIHNKSGNGGNTFLHITLEACTIVLHILVFGFLNLVSDQKSDNFHNFDQWALDPVELEIQLCFLSKLFWAIKTNESID